MSERELRKDIDTLRIIIDKTLDMEIKMNKCVIRIAEGMNELEERVKKLEDAGQSITDSGDKINGYSDKVEEKEEEVPKMGEWMQTTVHGINVFRCTLCGAFSDARYPYCQWCGSKMKNNNLRNLFEED